MVYPSFVDVLAKLFHEKRNAVFALDPRSYPSKFMKKGVDDAALARMFVILDVVLRAMLEARQTKLKQIQGEAALDKVDAKNKNFLHKLTWGIKVPYPTWRKDFVFSTRVMLAHLRIRQEHGPKSGHVLSEKMKLMLRLLKKMTRELKTRVPSTPRSLLWRLCPHPRMRQCPI